MTGEPSATAGEPSAEELAAVLAALRRPPGGSGAARAGERPVRFGAGAAPDSDDPLSAALARWRRGRRQALRRIPRA